MVNYRRNRLAGGTYFFTATLHDRRATYLTAHIDELRQAIHDTRAARSFQIDAIVVLPDHLHTIWTLPSGDGDYAGRWRMLKSRFTRLLVKKGVDITCNAKNEYALWQRRYWEHTIRGDEGLQRHVDYVHYNPVKHGFVKHVADWPYSSFHRHVQAGLVPIDWTGMDVGIEGFGE